MITTFNGVRYLDTLAHPVTRLRSEKDAVNRLNVFPVPDGDTGTNMLFTLQAALQAGVRQQDEHLGALSRAVARGAMRGARGNSGVILSQYLLGLANGFDGLSAADSGAWVRALETADRTAYQAVISPVEGTILTVGHAAAEAARHSFDARRTSSLRLNDDKDLLLLFEDVCNGARQALLQTPLKLQVLREAGVVDAGGKGLLIVLESVLHVLQRGEIKTLDEPRDRINIVAEVQWGEAGVGETQMSENDLGMSSEERAADDTTETDDIHHSRISAEDITFVYCTEFIVHGYTDRERLKSKLMDLGDSLLVTGDDAFTKVHVHTNHPGKALEIALQYGDLTDIHISNMVRQRDEFVQKQVHGARQVLSKQASASPRRIAIVTDSAADLTPELCAQHGIHVVPLVVKFGDMEYYDGVNLSHASFYEMLRELSMDGNVLPATSQPTPEQFAELYEQLHEEGVQHIISIHLSSKLSGTVQSATLAAREMERTGMDISISVVDSLQASMGTGLLAIEAARRASRGEEPHSIVEALRKRSEHLRIFFVVDTLRFLTANGRIGKAQAMLGSLLNYKPVLTVVDGVVAPLAKVRGNEQAMQTVVDNVRSVLGSRKAVGTILHADVPEQAHQLKTQLETVCPDLHLDVQTLGATIGTHTGPGTIGVVVLPDDDNTA